MIEFLEYPNGVPVYWRNETSGKLEGAVNRLFLGTLENGDLALLKTYISHWLYCPSFTIPNKDSLLQQLETATTATEILKVSREMTRQGIDPF